MKKAHYVLVAATAILLTSCNAALIPTLTKITSPDLVNSIDIRSADPDSNRSLRTGKIVEGENNLDQGEESDEEERGLPPGVPEKVTSTLSKWAQTTSALNKIDDEVAKIAGYKAFYKDLFKAMAESGKTPRTLSTQFDIIGKVNTMKRAELLYDGEYMLWLTYWRWWGKNIAKKKTA